MGGRAAPGEAGRGRAAELVGQVVEGGGDRLLGGGEEAVQLGLHRARHERREPRVGRVAGHAVDAVEQLGLEDVVGVDDVAELEDDTQRLEQLLDLDPELDEEGADRRDRLLEAGDDGPEDVRDTVDEDPDPGVDVLRHGDDDVGDRRRRALEPVPEVVPAAERLQRARLGGGPGPGRGIQAGPPVLALEGVDRQRRGGRGHGQVGRRNALVVVARVADTGGLQHDRGAVGGDVDRRVLAAGGVGVGDVLARARGQVAGPARREVLAARGRRRADRAGHLLDGGSRLLGLVLLLLCGAEQRRAAVAPARLHRPVLLRRLEVGAGRVVGAGLARVGGVRGGHAVVELAVGQDQDPLMGIHERGPGTQRRGRRVRLVAAVGLGGATDDDQGAVGAGLDRGVLVVAGAEGEALAVDQDGRVGPVGPELHRLVGERGLGVAEQGQLGPVARRPGGVVGRLRRVVEVLHELRLDDEGPQLLHRLVHPEAEHLRPGSGAVAGKASTPVDDPATDGPRQRDEGRVLGGDRHGIAAGRVEQQQARQGHVLIPFTEDD
ncbi:MAG: hypothetical protein L0I76_25665, partial [Pseudonocardia sp.]|nr:hypothetical protein [Pseudonocardia sp.]